jgi:hypothetical protein
MTVVALKPEKKMFVYMVPPIDYWQGWIAEREFLTSYVQDRTYEDIEWTAHRIKAYSAFREGALALAKRMGWEGDIHDGPYVAAVPAGDCESDFMIAWKQCSNGDTFIVSPFWLPWLEEWKL